MVRALVVCGGNTLPCPTLFGGATSCTTAPVSPLAGEPQVFAGDAVAARQYIHRQRRHLAAGACAVLGEKRRRARTDAANFFYRHILQTFTRLPRRDDGDAVRFHDVRSVLGRELGGRRANRTRQAIARLPHQLLRHARHVFRGTVQTLAMGHVEKRLVHAEHLDVRGNGDERMHDAGGYGRVHVRPRRALDEIRAQFARVVDAHAGFHAKGARFVRAGNEGRADRTVRDAHRLAAQFRRIALLDRREERIHVDVQDGALYTSLHRLEERGCVESEWGRSDKGKRARFYSITRAGRRQLARETLAHAERRERRRHDPRALTVA